MQIKAQLWSINRWLRYTGFRVFVELPDRPGEDPTSVGVIWVGLPGSAGWRRWEGP